MSASTRTIQRPMVQGSIIGAIAVGVATGFAVGALTWGGLNATATKQSATSVASTTYVGSGVPDTHAVSNGDPSSIVSQAGPLDNGTAHVQTVAPITPFDIDTAHAAPWVDPDAQAVTPVTTHDIDTHAAPWVESDAQTASPITPFDIDTAHAAPWVDPDAGDTAPAPHAPRRPGR